MGFYKTFIKIVLIVFFGSLIQCKSEKKIEILPTKEVVIKKDTTSKYPKYLTKNYVLGKFDYIKDSSFTKVPKEYSNKTIYLRKEALEAFLEMQKEAEKDSIYFTIISGTRNFEHQKRIWNYKWNKKYKNFPPLKRVKKILEYSSMPSTSRHHWGTDIDLNRLTNHYFSYGKGLKEYNWLVKNAPRFGFYQPYTSKENGRKGYNEEKWHWSYVPLSKIYLQYFNKHLTYKDITNFKGAHFAKELNIISDYVNGVNPKTLKPEY